MSTLIVYMSKHGCAEKAALLIRQYITDQETTVVDLKKDKNVDPSRYDGVIIGGSIYLGALQKGLKRFCEKNLEVLAARKLGLFICSMNEGDDARAHFDSVYDQRLRDVSVADGLFGGELDFEKLSAIEKAIIGQVVAITESVSRFNESAIRIFAETFSQSPSRSGSMPC